MLESLAGRIRQHRVIYEDYLEWFELSGVHRNMIDRAELQVGFAALWCGWGGTLANPSASMYFQSTSDNPYSWNGLNKNTPFMDLWSADRVYRLGKSLFPIGCDAVSALVEARRMNSEHHTLIDLGRALLRKDYAETYGGNTDLTLPQGELQNRLYRPWSQIRHIYSEEVLNDREIRAEQAVIAARLKEENERAARLASELREIVTTASALSATEGFGSW